MVQFCPKGHDTFIVGRTNRRCQVCATEHQKYMNKIHPEIHQNRNKRNKTKSKEAHWKTFGIINSDGSPFTMKDYEQKYKEQNGQCAICGKHQSEFKRKFAADHDHKTGFIRGLLCLTHNRLLGCADDNIHILEYSIKYLKNYKSGSIPVLCSIWI